MPEISIFVWCQFPVSEVTSGVHAHIALVILLGLDFMMSLRACYKSDGSNFTGKTHCDRI